MIMTEQVSKPSLYCISFDGVVMSGIVEECLKTAYLFHQRGFPVYLDLGLDIKARKPGFGREYTEQDRAMFPEWVRLCRLSDLHSLPNYNRDFILDLIERVVKGSRDCIDAEIAEAMVGLRVAIRSRLLTAWERNRVRHILVENGTLPENLVFTLALRDAIQIYGQRHKLGKYVIWRDHDLMWSYVKGRYGSGPYHNIPKPFSSRHIHYVVTSSWVQRKVMQWAPGVDIRVLPFFHTFDRTRPLQLQERFRSRWMIPASAYLIARCSRIIPEKRIDRDIRLLAGLHRRFTAEGRCERLPYLFVTGLKEEEPEAAEELINLAKSLGVLEFVQFGNGLRSFEPSLFLDEPHISRPEFSVRDLVQCADLSSFLTSFRFEGYGLPPGEAIACGTAYCASTYELYDSIYGSKGFKAPLMSISDIEDGLPRRAFVEEIAEFLSNEPARKVITRHNFELGQRLISMDRLRYHLSALLPDTFNRPAAKGGIDRAREAVCR